MFLVGWSRVPQAPGMTVRAKIETIADIAEEYAHAHASNAVEKEGLLPQSARHRPLGHTVAISRVRNDYRYRRGIRTLVFADVRLWRVRSDAMTSPKGQSKHP